jgi:hypothetical protein
MENKKMNWLLCLLFLTVTTVFGQVSSFYKVFSGNGYDKGEGITQLSDSSYMITGSSSSFEDAPSQAFLLHIDKLGNFISSMSYGGPESEEGRRVFAIENDSYTVAGTSSSGPSANFDGYVFKTDFSGNLIWEHFLDFGSWERINDAILLADSSIIVTGETDSTVTGNYDIILARIDKNGTILWSQKMGSEGEDIGQTLELFDANHFLLGGTIYNADSLKSKGFIAKFHIDATEIWRKEFGTIGVTKINDIVLNSSFITILGETFNESTNLYMNYDARLDLNGLMLFINEPIISYNSRYVAAINYLVGSGTKFFCVNQTINTGIPTFLDGEDFYVSRFASGFYWDNYGLGYNGIGQDQTNQLIPTLDGYGILVGYHTTIGYGGNSIFVVKLGDENTFPNNAYPPISPLVSVVENELSEQLSVYPNPFNDQLTFTIESQEGVFELMNATGAIVYTGTFNQTADIATNELAKGIYYLKISAANKWAVCKLIKE